MKENMHSVQTCFLLGMRIRPKYSITSQSIFQGLMAWDEDEALYEAILQFENDQAHGDGILCTRYRFAEPLVEKDIDDKIR